MELNGFLHNHSESLKEAAFMMRIAIVVLIVCFVGYGSPDIAITAGEQMVSDARIWIGSNRNDSDEHMHRYEGKFMIWGRDI